LDKPPNKAVFLFIPSAKLLAIPEMNNCSQSVDQSEKLGGEFNYA